MKYNPSKIEKKWQKYWKEQGTYRHYDRDKKFYALDMFPYPSGSGLHVGHPKGYIATDVVARYKQLQGFGVLHPMGWDAFGLPAENYAIKNKIHPRKSVEENIARFKEQLKQIGFTYDWDREINTTDPEYYKWTQWIFLKMFEHGLAYESYEPINWCPSCKTGLANEDLEDGKCERCGSEIEQRPMRQWVLRMTNYADRLLEDLDTQDLDWEGSIIDQQKNWIGRSYGAEVIFKLKAEGQELNSHVKVFTTRVDTIFSGTYIILAPENNLITELESKISNFSEVQEYIVKAKKKTNLQRVGLVKEKEGIQLKGIVAINPATNEEIPVWTSDFVLVSYGTGAVFADAHDERDFEMSKKYGIPLKVSIRPQDDDRWEKVQKFEECFSEEGILVNSGEFNGLTSQEACPKIIEWLEKKGLAKRTVNYKMRDWVFSRQRYWGEPIPIVHCERCAFADTKVKAEIHFRDDAIWKEIISGRKTIETRALNPEEPDRYFGNVKRGDHIRLKNMNSGEERIYAVSESYIFENLENLFDRKDILPDIFIRADLRTLAELKKQYTSISAEYLAKINKNGLVAWRIQPISMAIAVPEENLPVVLPDVERYEPIGTGESPLAGIDEWVNTKCPKCGGPAKRETNTMPQWAGSSWYYLRYIDSKNTKVLVEKEKEKEWMPVDLYVGGAEHATRHLLYARFWHKFLYDIGVVSTIEPFKKLVHVGLINAADGRKMSKRWNNVINPDDVIAEFGADSLRLYEMFMGPFTQNIAWNTEGVSGVRRFLEKVWKLFDRVTENKESKDVEVLLHKTIKKVTEDIENFRFNTAISSLMILVNRLEKEESLSTVNYQLLTVLLSPFAPHIAEELWEKMGHTTSIFLKQWPAWNEKLIVDETVTLVVQVNGKVRDTLAAPSDIDEARAKELALASGKVQKFIAGKEIRKVIFVRGKLVNIVA